MKNNIYTVILAGGSGERLWPLSTKKRPKQIIPFEKSSLLQQTVKRCKQLVPLQDCYIVTGKDQYKQTQKNVKEAIGHWVLEPCARNSAAAMVLAAAKLTEKGPDAVAVFMPADHYIPETEKFTAFIEHAVQAAQETDKIVLLGIKPTYPATGYGYIAYQQEQTVPSQVLQFHEKPDQHTAQTYLEKNYLWNSGIVVAKISVFLEEIMEHAPEIFEGVCGALLGQEYSQIPALSIDYALMEKSNNLLVLPVDCIWSDVGNLETFLKLEQQTNAVVSVNANNNLVHVDNKLVALVGVDNLCVVEHNGVLVVAHKEQVERVKEVVQQLEQQKQYEYL